MNVYLVRHASENQRMSLYPRVYPGYVPMSAPAKSVRENGAFSDFIDVTSLAICE
jgi:hypothetical protein